MPKTARIVTCLALHDAINHRHAEAAHVGAIHEQAGEGGINYFLLPSLASQLLRLGEPVRRYREHSGKSTKPIRAPAICELEIYWVTWSIVVGAPWSASVSCARS